MPEVHVLYESAHIGSSASGQGARVSDCGIVRGVSCLLLVLLAMCLSSGTAGAQTVGELADAGHWKRVRAAAEARVRANAKDAEALWLLARAREAFGDREGALLLAQRAVALEPRNAAYHLQVALLCGGQAASASFIRQISLGRRVKSELDTALALDPKNVDGLLLLMEFQWNAPGILGGNKEKAGETARRIGQIDPVRGYLAQAQLARRDKDTGRVEALYRKAVEANPRSYLAQMTMANFHSSGVKPQLDLAEKHAREALALAPDRAAPYSLLARVHAAQGRLADLDAILADAERRVLDNPSPFLSAANALLRSGSELPRAESYIRKYLLQEREGNTTTHGVARWRLALVLEKQGRIGEALAELEAARRLEPKRDEIANDLQRLKKAQGNVR